MNSEIFTVGETWRSILISLDKIKVSWLKFSMGLTNRRPSKNMLFLFLLLLFFLFYFIYFIFFFNVNCPKVSGYFKSHYFGWSSRDSGSQIKILSAGKNNSHVLKNSRLEIILRPYNLPFFWKGRENLQNTTVNIDLYRRVIFTLTLGLNFHLITVISSKI